MDFHSKLNHCITVTLYYLCETVKLNHLHHLLTGELKGYFYLKKLTRSDFNTTNRKLS